MSRKQLNRSAVRVYGALSALGMENGNVLESLLPFFDPILRQQVGKKLDPDVIAASVRETYRWNFNSDLVETFIPYLVQHGWITPDLPGRADTTYTVQMLEGSDFDASAQSVEAALREIAIQFKEFSEGLSPLTTIPRDVEEFEDILVEWLLYVEAFSENSIDFKASVKRDAMGKLRQTLEIPSNTTLRDEEKFLCARFVKHSLENNKGSAEVLSRIAAIGLLTEVVQDFVKPITSIERTDLVVYLDAPVAMELLGLSGRLARENTAPIIQELIRIGAAVRIFGQSVDEIKNSLKAVLKNPRPTGPTAQAMLRREVLREYVVEAARNPTPLLGALGVKVALRTREQTPSEHQFFTLEDWQNLYSKLSYSENPTARDHDTDITAFVVRQRRGRTSRDLFSSYAVALTRNGLFAQIIRRMHTEMDAANAETVPPVIHRRVLATALWLRTGMGAGDLNIPKRMLLATCEHVLAIRPGVVEAVKRLTDAMGDEEKSRQLDLLVSQDRSTQALMDKTLGATNVVTEENFSLLWNEMLHPHLEEERKKAKDAVQKARAEAKVQLGKAHQEMESLQIAREREAQLLHSQLTDLRLQDQQVMENLCFDVSRALQRRRLQRIGIGIFAGLVFSLPLILETSPMVRWSSFVIGWLLAYLTATGGSLISTKTDADTALRTLHSTATRRGLQQKVDQFEIEWIDSKLKVVGRREEISA